MSIIIHRCSCGHPDVYHQHPQIVGNGGHCSYGTCQAREHVLGKSELIPTFVDGIRNDYVHKPGAKTAGLTLCGCADCLALYETVKTPAKRLHPWYSREAS